MKQRLLHILLISFFSLASLISLYGQKEQEASDTIYHYEDHMLHKQQKFYKKWQQKTAKHKWTKEIFNILFDPPAATSLELITRESNARSFMKYEGKTIQNITFKIVPPFGKTMNGVPTDSTDNKLAEFGNRMNMNTKEKHLERILSIKEGRQLDIKLLEDNEEMLRSLDYVDDLFITIEEVDDNRININFLVKERFAWSASYQAHDLNAHKAKLYNKNLWGLGHQARFSYYYNPNKKIVNSLDFRYSIPSIGRSLISTGANIEHNNHNDRYGIELNRGFIDYTTKYAGGINLNLVKNADYVPTNHIANFENNIDFHEVDLWGGASIHYNLDIKDKYARHRKAITGRFYRVDFTRHPEIRPDSNAFLLKTTGALLGYNVSKQQLYLSNLLYCYGRIENIPYGHLAQFFVGTVYNKWDHKGYMGVNFEKAFYDFNKNYYFATRLSGGTFFNSGGFLEGQITAEGKYISKLYKFRNTKHRHFIKLKYIIGLNPTDDFVNLNESSGLRNFESEFAKGDQKLVLNIEDVFFTPITIAGFRTAIFSFADLAYIGSNNSPNSNRDNFFAGIGMGIRLNNNNFIFDTFQISFSLFLKRPEDVNFFRPDASSVQRGRFDNFQIEKPYFFFERENFRY